MLYYRKKLPFQFYSLLVHALLVGSFFTISKTTNLFSSEVDTKNIRIVGKAIRVDVVAMPTMTIQELKKVEEAPGEVEPAPVVEEKKEEAGGDENVVFEKEKKEKPSFADLMKNLSARDVKKEKIKPKDPNEAKKQKGAGGISGDSYKKIMALGNRLAEGSALVGSGGENSGDQFDQYALKVMESVRRYWTLPGFLSGLDLSCHIQVFINDKGQLIKAEILKSSGNSEYDNRAMAAVKQVSSFPIPDGAIANKVATGNIALAFPL